MNKQQLDHLYYNTKELKLPLDLGIKIPFDSEVRTFDEVFYKSGVKKHLVANNKLGRDGYNLVSMLKLVLFCNMINIYSLRDMAKAAENDIRIMWLTDEITPSHQAIGNFINNHLSKNIKEIFKELNQYIIKEENIDQDIIFIDGTKIESAANKYTFVWRGSIEKFEEKLHKKITKLIISLNKEYSPYGIIFNEAKKYKVSYLKKIKVFLNEEITSNKIQFVHGKGKRKTALQRHFEKTDEYITKLNEYQTHLEIMGPTRNSYSKTYHDATFMRMKEDHMQNQQLKPGYNLQIGVSDEYIIHLMMSSERSDFNTFIPFLEGYKDTYGKYPKYPVADSGYGSLYNYRYLKLNEMELYQKYGMYEKDTSDKKYLKDEYRPHNYIKLGDKSYQTKSGEVLVYQYTDKYNKDYYYSKKLDKIKMIHEENLGYQKEAIKNLKSELGIELRVQRSIQVEGALGVIKENYGIRRFRRKGMLKVELEMTLTAIGYNLLKFHNKRYRIIE